MSRRDQIVLSDAELAQLLGEERIAVVSSLGPRGWPHSMPLWFVPREGEIWIWTYAKSQKVRNLERDPRVKVAANVFDVIGVIEPIGQRHPIDVPLSRVIRPVAQRAQHLGQEFCPLRALTLTAARHARHRIAPDLLGVIPREQGSPRRPAAGRVVKLREPQAARGQLVEIRRVDLAAVATQVRVPEIIGEDDNDIGTCRARAGLRKGAH